MKKALIDASSAILLAKAGLFYEVTHFYDVRMVAPVYDEITPDSRPCSHLFLNCLQQGRITVLQAPDNTGPSPIHDAGFTRLHHGERETLGRYYLGREDLIIIDDGKGAGFCRKNTIPYINALLCPKVLYFAGRLNNRAYQHFSQLIIAAGRYADWVIETADRLTQADLADFL